MQSIMLGEMVNRCRGFDLDQFLEDETLENGILQRESPKDDEDLFY